MIAAEVRIDIACPPEEVFDFVAVRYFENLRRWHPRMIEITELSAGPVRVGTRGVLVELEKHGKGPRKPFGRTLEVTTFEPPRAFGLGGIASSRLADAWRSSFVFSPVGSRTRLVHRFEQDYSNPLLPPLSFIGDAILRMRLNRRLRALRDALESARLSRATSAAG